MNPQLAIATSGKVRRPALRARFSRSQPIGTASAKAAASATKMNAYLKFVQSPPS